MSDGGVKMQGHPTRRQVICADPKRGARRSRGSAFWGVAGRTRAAEGKVVASFFAAEIVSDPISALAKNSDALVIGSPPADFPAKTVRFDTVNNEQIVGWMAPGKKGYASVLLLHGLRGDRRQMLGRARFLNRLGYGVLLIDLPGHGESSNRKITFGYQESAAVQAALTYLSASSPNNPVSIIGVSLGAAAIVLADDLQPKPAAIVLESMYPTIEEALDDRLKLHLGESGFLLKPFLLLQFPLRLGLQPDQLQPIKRIKFLKSPVMIISGTDDRHTTLGETLKIFNAASAPKSLWLVQNAGHQNLYAYSSYLYEQKVSSFIELYMPRL